MGHFSYAQRITFGPVLGSNLTWAKVNGNDIHVTPTTGYTVGGFARVKFLKLYVQPEVLYAQKGVNFKTPDPSTGVDATQKLRYNTVDVNLMFGMQLFRFFDDSFGMRFHAGPGITNYVPSEVRYNGNEIDESQLKLKSYTTNWQLGIGVDLLNRFFVDFRYGFNFDNMVETGPYTIVPKQATILVAYKLIKER